MGCGLGVRGWIGDGGLGSMIDPVVGGGDAIEELGKESEKIRGREICNVWVLRRRGERGRGRGGGLRRRFSTG